MLTTSSRPPSCGPRSPLDPPPPTTAQPQPTQEHTGPSTLARMAWCSQSPPGPRSGRPPRQQVPWGPWTNLEQLQSPATMAFSAAKTGGKWQVASLTLEPPSCAGQESALAVLQDKGRGRRSGWSRAPHSNCHLVVAPDGQTQLPCWGGVPGTTARARVGRAPTWCSAPTPTPAHVHTAQRARRCSPRPHSPEEAPALCQSLPWLWFAPGRSQAQTHQGGTGGPDTLQHLADEHRAQERLWGGRQSPLQT